MQRVTKSKLVFAQSIDHRDRIFMYKLSVKSKKITSVIAKLFEHSCINSASIAEWIAGIVCALCSYLGSCSRNFFVVLRLEMLSFVFTIASSVHSL